MTTRLDRTNADMRNGRKTGWPVSGIVSSLLPPSNVAALLFLGALPRAPGFGARRPQEGVLSEHSASKPCH